MSSAEYQSTTYKAFLSSVAIYDVLVAVSYVAIYLVEAFLS